MSVVALGDFQPLVIATDVDEAVIGILKRWMPTYLRQIATERGLAKPLPVPPASAYVNAIDVHEGFDRPLPVIIVSTAQMPARPVRLTNGYTAIWRTTVSVIVRSRTPVETRRHAALFEGSVRGIMLNQADPSGLISDVTWQPSDGVSAIPDVSRQGRYLAVGSGTYDVAVDLAVGVGDAPTVPDADTYLPDAVVTEVDVTVNGFAPDDPGGPS